jgi:hypothetical protein
VSILGKVSGTESIAIGYKTVTNGNDSINIGSNKEANTNEINIGKNTVTKIELGPIVLTCIPPDDIYMNGALKISKSDDSFGLIFKWPANEDIIINP